MNPGFVYILINESMPGLVKIGRTSRDVDIRAAELWQTGVPTKFEVWASEKTCDCAQLEAYLHGDLRKYRVTKSREFFKIDPDAAQEQLRFWVEYQASELVRENFSSIAAVPYRALVDSCAVESLAERVGHDTWIVASALADLTPDEITPAIARIRAARREEEIEVLRSIGIPESEWEGMLNV